MGQDFQDTLIGYTPFAVNVGSMARILSDETLDSGSDDSQSRGLVVLQNGLLLLASWLARRLKSKLTHLDNGIGDVDGT